MTAFAQGPISGMPRDTTPRLAHLEQLGSESDA
jgi:hypothetical protein